MRRKQIATWYEACQTRPMCALSNRTHNSAAIRCSQLWSCRPNGWDSLERCSVLPRDPRTLTKSAVERRVRARSLSALGETLVRPLRAAVRAPSRAQAFSEVPETWADLRKIMVSPDGSKGHAASQAVQLSGRCLGSDSFDLSSTSGCLLFALLTGVAPWWTSSGTALSQREEPCSMVQVEAQSRILAHMATAHEQQCHPQWYRFAQQLWRSS